MTGWIRMNGDRWVRADQIKAVYIDTNEVKVRCGLFLFDPVYMKASSLTAAMEAAEELVAMLADDPLEEDVKEEGHD